MKDLKKSVLLFLLACTLSAPVLNAAPLNIKDSGVVGDGKTEDTKGFLKAWDEACAAAGGATISIPKGTYLVGPMTFIGPCKGPITMQLDGTLLATTDLASYKSNWIQFEHVTGLTVTGTGTVDGQGKSAWPSNKCLNGNNCNTLPMSLVFAFCEGLTVHGIHSVNSKYFHVNVFSSKNIELSNLDISAPGDSPNTDGIHIGDNTNVTITDTTIGTGDDCISIGPGSVDVKITKVDCGPGHGISVGSLGRYKGEKDVKGLLVQDCTLTGTTNGVRIKTWQDNPSPLVVSDITFERITMKDVLNPVIIDQQYCPHDDCKASAPSTVKIEGVTIRDIKGTSATSDTVTIICSEKNPCEGLKLEKIEVKAKAGAANTTCLNAQGTSDTTVKSQCLT